MTESTKTESGDRALGMDASITRRDFLGSTLLASGASLLTALSPTELLATSQASSSSSAQEAWTGFGGVGDYSRSNGNTYEIMQAGHNVRDRAYDPLPADTIDTGEMYDCVVIGGGISGLAAALFFQRLAGPNKT